MSRLFGDLMESFTLGDGRKMGTLLDIKMGMECSSVQITATKVNIVRIKKVETEYANFIMEMFSKENGERTRCKGKGYILRRVVQYITREFGRKES